MISVIDIATRPSIPTPEGSVRHILVPADHGTRADVAIAEIDPGRTCQFAPSNATRVAYILDGKDANVVHTAAGQTAERTAQRRSGVYLEPGESAAVTASGHALTLLLVTVPKHTRKPTGNGHATGYLFEE